MTSLPGLVRRYAEHALPEGASGATEVWLEQVGEMTLKRGARPRRFTAVERFQVDRVAFSWRARFPVLGPLGMHVVDSYAEGEGGIEVRFLGLPVQRSRGPALAQGQALRYLAELPLVAPAVLANSELDWRELDERTAEVGTRVGSQRVAVRLGFGEDAEVLETVAHRPRAESDNAVTPWIGTYSDYALLGGVRVPTRAEVRWELPDGPFTYWRGSITSVELRA
jgi:hypothetical protein